MKGEPRDPAVAPAPSQEAWRKLGDAARLFPTQDER